MFTEIRYTWVVNKGKLADYFEKNYLQYQLKHGRCSQDKYAKLLGFSKGYLNQLLEGKKTTLGYHAALFVARFTEDYEILDILGYDRPVNPFPSRLSSALESARLKIIEAGISGESPEASMIIDEAMKAAGYRLISTTDKESE
jgi:transcriptional regulator with XRE-family HTH domain